MKLENAKKIIKRGKSMGYTFRLYKEYSGRGMFGRKTSGVTGDYNQIMKVIQSFGKNANNQRTDNMGKSDMIVY